jgi:hypothetical protein
MRLASTLLILFAFLVAVAVVPVGWKWADKPKAKHASVSVAAVSDDITSVSGAELGPSVNVDGWTWGDD